jgi:8-oxo-dGTP pyrophosphatase MutT (NUDIX family)
MKIFKQAVIGIIEKDDLILLGLKRKSKKHFLSNQWHLPGGGVEKGERYLDALVREIKEETNLSIGNIRCLASSVLVQKYLSLHWYACSQIGGILNAQSDLVDAKYVPKSDLRKHCSERTMSVWPIEVRKYLGVDLHHL